MEESEVERSAMSSSLETRCNIDLSAAREEATWYSVLNVQAVCLGSGMGIRMNDDEVNNALDSVGLRASDLSFSNPSLLKAVFKSGDPVLTEPFVQNDFGTWKWAENTFDKTVVPQAQGWTILTECECARWFSMSADSSATPPEGRRDSMERAQLLSISARAQCNFAFDNLRNSDGLFPMAANVGSMTVVDSRMNLEDQACMLWACSDLASLAMKQGSMFADEAAADRYLFWADSLFEAIFDNKDLLLNTSEDKVVARAVGVSALIWYASVTKAQDWKAQALWLMREFADDLMLLQDRNEMVGDSIIDAAAALRAMVDAYRISKLRPYVDTAIQIFNFIESQWWKLPGVYSPTPMATEYTYNASDVGLLLGALNAGRLFLKDRVNHALAELRLRYFFCNAVNLSGLQMSMPNMTFLPDWLQEKEPSIHFRHNSIPLPSEANIAPVLCGEVSYDPQSDSWSREMLYDTPSAMRACVEFLWMNHEAVNGFPNVSLENAPIAVQRAAGIAA